MDRPRRISYAFMLLLLVAVGWLHMATLLLTVLFGYFALRSLSVGGSRIVGVLLFLIVVTGAFSGMWFFAKQAYVTFPRIAEETLPAIVSYAEERRLELPFTDWRSAKTAALNELQDKIANVGRYARDAVFIFVYLVIGLVVALSLFISQRLRLDADEGAPPDNLYAATALQIIRRMQTFYRSFTIVMGAQILIAAINTVLTGAFLFTMGFPYAPLLTVFVFLCGLLPIVGNIISNVVITAVGFTISPQMAFFALLFLVAIHKLEYFLNSKIIGDRIKNPMWLTLIGLLVGEKLMGIPGMILAPVVLHYIKVEASRARVAQETHAEEQAEEEIPA
ncbi:MAG: AI-2E family transporter [Limisphaerales bacterium]